MRNIFLLMTMLLSAMAFGTDYRYVKPIECHRREYAEPNFDVLLEIQRRKQEAEYQQTQIEKERAVGMMNQVKSYYQSLPSYPNRISDGWHKAIAMNNYDFCKEVTVYVENNKVAKFKIHDGTSRNFSYPTVIYNAKAMVQLMLDNGSTVMLDLYFLNAINNPNSYTSSSASETNSAATTAVNNSNSYTSSPVSLVK